MLTFVSIRNALALWLIIRMSDAFSNYNLRSSLTTRSLLCYKYRALNYDYHRTSSVVSQRRFYSARLYDVEKISNSSASSIRTTHQRQFVYMSQDGDTAGHMVNSTGLPPVRKNEEGEIIKRFKNFKDQWIKETGYPWPIKCSTTRCNNTPTLGAHVLLRGNEFIHLIPLCYSCNNDQTKNSQPNVIEMNNKSLIETDHLEQFDNWTYPIQIEDSTPCLELTHLHLSEYKYHMFTEFIPWDKMYERLGVHYKRHQCTSVGSKYESDQQLLRWAYQQRKRYKANTISSYQIKLLEEINFVWDLLSQKWEDNFTLLVQFKHREKHCYVPNYHKEDGENLGHWLNNQRASKNNGTLDTVKEKRLEDLGVVWNRLSQQWEDNFALLIQFKHREKHCNVPNYHKEDGENLEYWLGTQRTENKNRTLDYVRKKQLEDLGVIWDQFSQQWDDNFTLL